MRFPDFFSLPTNFTNSGPEGGEDLVLQGVPIGEPVVSRGPFVMNSDKEIAQAFADYRATQFGGWPWPRSDFVFPRDKGRFASKLEGGVLVTDLPPTQ